MGMNDRVLAGGVFNMVHPGHIHFLEKAKSLGGYLVVVVAADSRVASRKQLLRTAGERAKLLRELPFVDKVVIGDDRDMSAVVAKEKPDIVALGYDQDIEEVKGILRKAHSAAKIVRIQQLKGYSTKKLTGEEI